MSYVRFGLCCGVGSGLTFESQGADRTGATCVGLTPPPFIARFQSAQINTNTSHPQATLGSIEFIGTCKAMVNAVAQVEIDYAKAMRKALKPFYPVLQNDNTTEAQVIMTTNQPLA